ncbi:hypothetical protein HID58_061842 [Brassica napus]|uniref:Uncharacterized protein n=1 Tax=Brassica napus TaxID=3708 RepID=A0ABQ7ZZR7_BRANA|nr:hypothetical protein HID58_061842 [Brassica napus]
MSMAMSVTICELSPVTDIAGATATSSCYGKDEKMTKTVVADPRSVNAVLRGVAKWKVRYIKEVLNIASVTPGGKGLTTSEGCIDLIVVAVEVRVVDSSHSGELIQENFLGAGSK